MNNTEKYVSVKPSRTLCHIQYTVLYCQQSCVLIRLDRKLRIYSRGYIGAQNFNFAPKFHPNGDFQPQILYCWNRIFLRGQNSKDGAELSLVLWCYCWLYTSSC